MKKKADVKLVSQEDPPAHTDTKMKTTKITTMRTTTTTTMRARSFLVLALCHACVRMCAAGPGSSSAVLTILYEGNGYHRMTVTFGKDDVREFYECLCRASTSACKADYRWKGNRIEVDDIGTEYASRDNMQSPPSPFYRCKNVASTSEVVCTKSERPTGNSYQSTMMQSFSLSDATSCDFDCVAILWSSSGESLAFDQKKRKRDVRQCEVPGGEKDLTTPQTSTMTIGTAPPTAASPVATNTTITTTPAKPTATTNVTPGTTSTATTADRGTNSTVMPTESPETVPLSVVKTARSPREDDGDETVMLGAGLGVSAFILILSGVAIALYFVKLRNKKDDVETKATPKDINSPKSRGSVQSFGQEEDVDTQHPPAYSEIDGVYENDSSTNTHDHATVEAHQDGGGSWKVAITTTASMTTNTTSTTTTSNSTTQKGANYSNGKRVQHEKAPLQTLKSDIMNAKENIGKLTNGNVKKSYDNTMLKPSCDPNFRRALPVTDHQYDVADESDGAYSLAQPLPEAPYSEPNVPHGFDIMPSVRNVHTSGVDQHLPGAIRASHNGQYSLAQNVGDADYSLARNSVVSGGNIPVYLDLLGDNQVDYSETAACSADHTNLDLRDGDIDHDLDIGSAYFILEKESHDYETDNFSQAMLGQADPQSLDDDGGIDKSGDTHNYFELEVAPYEYNRKSAPTQNRNKPDMQTAGAEDNATVMNDIPTYFELESRTDDYENQQFAKHGKDDHEFRRQGKEDHVNNQNEAQDYFELEDQVNVYESHNSPETNSDNYEDVDRKNQSDVNSVDDPHVYNEIKDPSDVYENESF